MRSPSNVTGAPRAIVTRVKGFAFRLSLFALKEFCEEVGFEPSVRETVCRRSANEQVATTSLRNDGSSCLANQLTLLYWTRRDDWLSWSQIYEERRFLIISIWRHVDTHLMVIAATLRELPRGAYDVTIKWSEQRDSSGNVEACVETENFVASSAVFLLEDEAGTGLARLVLGGRGRRGRRDGCWRRRRRGNCRGCQCECGSQNGLRLWNYRHRTWRKNREPYRCDKHRNGNGDRDSTERTLTAIRTYRWHLRCPPSVFSRI